MFKQADKVNRLRYGNKLLKFFSNASNSSNVEEEIIKQINTLTPFNVEPHKAITKKPLHLKKKITVKKKLI